MGEQLGTRRTIPDESTEWNPCSGMGETAVYLVLPRLCRSCTHPPHQEVEEDEAPYRLFIWATSDTIVAGCPNKYMIYVTLLLIYVVASIFKIYGFTFEAETDDRCVCWLVLMWTLNTWHPHHTAACTHL